MARLLLTLLFIASCVLGSEAVVTTSQVNNITKALYTLHNDTRSDDGLHFRFSHRCVRLAFHDCVGNCDGCLNVNNGHNAGLADTVIILEAFYDQTGILDNGTIRNLAGFSRADLWALAGTTALEFLSECPKRPNLNNPCVSPLNSIPFKVGRVDCDSPNAPFTDVVHHFPDAHGNYSTTVEFFHDTFGFNESESVAILGAHTLGRTSTGNSGFSGLWVKKWDIPDNEYYRDLINGTKDWTQANNFADKPNRTPKWQWNSAMENDASKMMLNVDMSLVKDIVVNSAGESSCTYNDPGACSDSPGLTAVSQFAADTDFWASEFEKVFVRMVEWVADGVTLAEATPDDAGTSATEKDLLLTEESLLIKLLKKDLEAKQAGN